jgi:hypothetical protein
VNASARGAVTNSTSALGATSRSAERNHLRGDSEQARPTSRQLHAVAGTGQQIVEVPPPRGDGLRDRWLAHPERRGGRLDRAEPGHEDEGAQLGQCHWIIFLCGGAEGTATAKGTAAEHDPVSGKLTV